MGKPERDDQADDLSIWYLSNWKNNSRKALKGTNFCIKNSDLLYFPKGSKGNCWQFDTVAVNHVEPSHFT